MFLRAWILVLIFVGDPESLRNSCSGSSGEPVASGAAGYVGLVSGSITPCTQTPCYFLSLEVLGSLQVSGTFPLKLSNTKGGDYMS